MHEMSLCRSLVAEVERLASARGGTCVTRVSLRVGPLSGVEPALLRAAFPVVAAGSPAAGATLVIEEAGLRVLCERCGVESEVDPGCLRCAACGDWHTRLLGGDELLLTGIELRRARREAGHV